MEQKLRQYFLENLLEKTHLEINTMRAKRVKRWIIYSNEIDASKIPVEWYSWMHFTPNKIEKKHSLDKYDWQKPHKPNLTGTDEAYYPYKKEDAIKKKYKVWKK